MSVTTGDGLNETEREASSPGRWPASSRSATWSSKSRPGLGRLPGRVPNRRGANAAAALGPQDPWNDQVWEALLLIGEDSGSSDEIDDTLSTTVLGYYSPSEDEIDIVSPTETTTDRPANALTRTRSRPAGAALRAERLRGNAGHATSRQGVTEGEANYVRILYERQCGDGWGCIASRTRPATGEATTAETATVRNQATTRGCSPFSTSRTSPGRGSSTRCAPTAAGTPSTPSTTTSPTAPSRCSTRAVPRRRARDVSVADRSSDEWSRFDHDPVGDTVGETSIYAMMYHNGQTEGDRCSYESEISAGWGGDLVVPYRNGSGGYGYVWETRWDTEEDAASSHRRIGRRYRGTRRHPARESVYVVAEARSTTPSASSAPADRPRRQRADSADLDEIHRPQAECGASAGEHRIAERATVREAAESDDSDVMRSATKARRPRTSGSSSEDRLSRR